MALVHDRDRARGGVALLIIGVNQSFHKRGDLG